MWFHCASYYIACKLNIFLGVISHRWLYTKVEQYKYLSTSDKPALNFHILPNSLYIIIKLGAVYRKKQKWLTFAWTLTYHPRCIYIQVNMILQLIVAEIWAWTRTLTLTRTWTPRVICYFTLKFEITSLKKTDSVLKFWDTVLSFLKALQIARKIFTLPS
jgi:hypothetical protein